MLAKIVLAVVVFCVPYLCMHCLFHGAMIASDIHENVAKGIQTASISGVGIGVDGRDVTLTGNVASEDLKKKAGDLALSASGVRTVDNQLTIGGPVQTAAAPVADVATAQASINKILLEKRIEFATSRDTILPQSIPVLENVSKVLEKAPQLSVRIEGYTDSVGDATANKALSQARAEAVEGWLTQHGIAKARMSASGFGADKPVASNETAAGRFANRRVEIVAH